MNGLNKNKSKFDSNVNKICGTAANVADESKKIVTDLYDDSVKKVDSAQKKAEDFTEELMERVRENPVKSVLIAGGIGFLLSALLTK